MIRQLVYISLLAVVWISWPGQIWAQETETQPMEQRITMITLGVADMERATHFYENQFGWARSGMSNEQLIVYELPGLHLALYDRKALAEDATVPESGQGFSGFTLSHNVRSEAEVDQLITQLRDAGVTIVKEPQKVFWGGYSSYVSDPDGNLWEIAYNPYLKLD